MWNNNNDNNHNSSSRRITAWVRNKNLWTYKDPINWFHIVNSNWFYFNLPIFTWFQPVAEYLFLAIFVFHYKFATLRKGCLRSSCNSISFPEYDVKLVPEIMIRKTHFRPLQLLHLINFSRINKYWYWVRFLWVCVEIYSIKTHRYVNQIQITRVGSNFTDASLHRRQ